LNAPADYDLYFMIKEGLLGDTVSHILWKSDSISEMLLDRDVVTTGH